MSILDFRNKVVKEAQEQAALRKEHKPIPSSLKKYARLSGLGVWIVCGLGASFIFWIGWRSGWFYIFFILFFVVLSVMGFIQMLTGRQLLNRGK